MLNSRDRIITAKVRMQKELPFFSYLVMNFTDERMIEDEKIGTCAVDVKGNLYYNPKWIEKLSDNEVKTLLCHEIMHLALLHLTRINKRDRELWNVATDLVINNTLINNGFMFGKELDKGLIPRSNKYNFFGTEIKDIDKKIAEEIYVMLNQAVQQAVKSGQAKQGEDNKGGKGFDIHIFGKEGEEKENEKGKPKGKSEQESKNPVQCKVSQEELNKLEKEWKNKLVEASTYAKMKGNLPLGMERYIEEILESKLNWREILYKHITNEIPIDYSYNYPSKKSQSVGVYMPRIKKELIDITIAVDTSGSIGKDELTEFLSEVVAIGKSFENVRLNVFFMDADVHNHYVVTNGQVDDILNYEIKGGGGTDFSSCYDYCNKEIPNTRLLVFFTDGFATFPHQEDIKTLWILTKNGCKNDAIPYGEVTRLE